MNNNRKLIHEANDTVFACPNCNYAGQIFMRIGDRVTAGDPNDSLYCVECRESFNKPVVRPKQKGSNKQKYVDFTPETVEVDNYL